MLKNSLSPNLDVREPMLLRFFLEFVEDLPILELADASKHFEKALHWDIFAMLEGALAADHYWTERLTLLPDSTLSFLRRTILEGVPAVGWIDV